MTNGTKPSAVEERKNGEVAPVIDGVAVQPAFWCAYLKARVALEGVRLNVINAEEAAAVLRACFKAKVE